jgi:hypothetical protein
MWPRAIYFHIYMLARQLVLVYPVAVTWNVDLFVYRWHLHSVEIYRKMQKERSQSSNSVNRNVLDRIATKRQK